MKIPLVDLSWQHRQIRVELDRAFERILTDPLYDDLVYARELEPALATYFDIPNGNAVTVQSGSAAQFLALKAVGIGPGDEVITVPNSDLPTTSAISHTGATFRLVDIETATHNLDPEQLESAITPRTRAIVPVHMFGRPAAMDKIQSIAERHQLLVIEDATLALGAKHRGIKTGLWGHAAFFSFAPRKVIGGLSNGGLVVTPDPAVAHQVRLLRGYGQDPAIMEKPISERILGGGVVNVAEGYNLKLDGTQAAVILAKFRFLEEWARLRQHVADQYDERLAELAGVTPPPPLENGRHAWRNYVIHVPPMKRDAIRHYMAEQGVTTATLYIPPVHLQPVYASLGLKRGALPVAEALAESLLALPMHPGLTEEQVNYVADTLHEAVGRL